MEVLRLPAADPVTYGELGDVFGGAMGAALLLDAGLLLTVDEVHLAPEDDFAGVTALLQRATGRVARASGGAQTIDVDHARTGEVADLLTRGEQPTGADVAERLGQPQPAVAHLRSRLIKRGTICSQSRVLRSAVPGMADRVVREDE